MIGAVVLAAGRATRFGGGKVVAPFRGARLVRHAIERLRDAGVDEIVVVAGAELDLVKGAAAGLPVTVVENPSPDLGMSTSVRVGVTALGPDVRAVVIALGDQPLIDPAVVRALVEHWESSNVAAVVPVYRDGRGHPVLFDATLRGALLELHGDTGARDLLERLGERVARLAVDADAPRDVDTRQDLVDLERGETPAAGERSVRNAPVNG